MLIYWWPLFIDGYQPTSFVVFWQLLFTAVQPLLGFPQNLTGNKYYIFLVCKFRTCVTENGHPGLLFAYSFWLLLLYFWDLCVNKNVHHGLWFAYTFVIFPLQLLHRFLQITVGSVCSLITSVYIFFSVKFFLWQCVLLLHYCYTLILFIYIFQVTLMELQGYLKVTNQGIPA